MEVTTGQLVEAKVKNTITRNKGSLKITKILDNPDGWTPPAGFTYRVNYDCVGDNDGHVNLPGVGGSDRVEHPDR